MPWMYCRLASNPSFASCWGEHSWSHPFSHLMVFPEMDRKIFREGLSPSSWISLSTRPFWSTLSMSSPWPQELRRLWYLRPSLPCYRLLSLRCPTFVTMAPVTPWGMVSSDSFTTSNRFHIWMSRNLPRTYSAREDEPLRLLLYSLTSIR